MTVRNSDSASLERLELIRSSIMAPSGWRDVDLSPSSSEPGIEKSWLNSHVCVSRLRKASQNGGYDGVESVKKLPIQKLSYFHPCISERRLNHDVIRTRFPISSAVAPEKAGNSDGYTALAIRVLLKNNF